MRGATLGAILFWLAAGVEPGPFPTQGVFTPSPYSGLREPVVEALLYNPPVDEVSWQLPYEPKPVTQKVSPVLVVYGRGLGTADGPHVLAYRIEAGESVLSEGKTEVTAATGGFEVELTLAAKFPQATGLRYTLLTRAGARVAAGLAPFNWSRFSGRLKYLDGRWRPSYIHMRPNGFRGAGSFHLPVGDDGRFDALVPARVYSVLNVNGAGYKYDAMERWAWDYDLTRPREDEFTLDRTELYSMKAFDVNGPVSTIFVMFRPTALSRVMKFDADADGLLSREEEKRMLAAMKDSPTVIGPELDAADVRIWLNGKEERIVRFDKVPEYDGVFWQVQYLAQIFPDPRPARGAWHEIKVEVRSRETHRGRPIVDFGQGSVGFQRY